MSLFSLFAAGDTSPASAPQTDDFPTPNGKTVTFTCIKHATLRIQYDGLEIRH